MSQKQTKKTLVVEQYASATRRPQAQRKILQGLGLGRIGKRKQHADNDSIRGMVACLAHMVRIVEPKDNIAS